MEILKRDIKRVCFFDSGIGGINLLKRSADRLPDAQFYYFADNFNMPYGSLSQEEITKRADEAFAKIAKLNPSAAVIACNTVTAASAEYLRGKYKFPIIGIQPAVKPAAESGGKCVVLATPSTAQSAAVNALVKLYGKGKTEILPCACLAAYVEKNIFSIDAAAIKALLPEVKADSVVLGCTHYIFVKEMIKEFYGCDVFDGVDGTVNRLCAVLGEKPAEEVAQGGYKVVFAGGDTLKNRRVFNAISGISGCK